MPGSILTASKNFLKNASSGAIKETFTAGEALVTGDVVKISANGTVAKSGVNDTSVGFVIVGGASGAKVTIMLNKVIATTNVIGTGGAIAAGALVTFTGIDSTTGLPTVAATASTKEAHGVVFKGATNAEMYIGLILGYKVAP